VSPNQIDSPLLQAANWPRGPGAVTRPCRVLLDTYFGVMHGVTQVGLTRWEQALADRESPDLFAD
jgi:hypothetical protein